MVSKKEQFPALTGLRFVAAASVVVGHAGHVFPPSGPIVGWHYYMAIMPALGMPLFFTLSGFVIYWNYSNILDGRLIPGLWRFFVARFSRLYPLYALVLLISFGQMWGFGGLPAETKAYLPNYLTLTQTWFYGRAGNLDVVNVFGAVPSITWSVSTEWFFYAAFPFICAGILRIKSVGGYVAATISYYVMERPLLRLKDRIGTPRETKLRTELAASPAE